MTKEIAYNKIEELVTRFSEQIVSYKKSEYNETLTRRDFIDPFFKALGWDVDNEQGNAEAYREVIHEDKIKIGSATKAPDYSFRLSGGKRLFFVEAKKPSVFIKDEILPAYQVRRYGWSAKLPISIITDFEEFAIYDCSKKPLPTDKASVARIKYLNYKEYLTEFDFIWDTFSKEKVLKGSFDKFIQGTANKKGTTTVDAAFLQTLDNCRTILAESIAKLNPALDEDEINFAVQQTIDRILFLRIAEDRSIEPYGKLQESLKFGNFYNNLFENFKIADDKYNSGLFNFKKDVISKNLQIDNKVLKTIINQFYYPECPYEFSVLSVEILGSAYEQFLGKTITINKNHKAVIELKPEVRKAGGVYYTPQYIVDYIVENTLGKLTQNKTPKQIAELKIVDPACGSGSFLIGAYQHLLNYHSNYYQKNQAQAKKDKAFTPTGSLSTSIKKQILLNNIYGVDIDVNAVEVTKLSLLLKCMEGETQASITNQASLFNERVLPTLDDNIKSGNSLIDTDYYDTQLDFGEEKKIKPFSWQKAFPNVFKNGGFDAVIGNPPYVQPNVLDKHSQIYLYKSYVSSTDLYSMFIEKTFTLLAKGKIFGFIVPSLFIKGVHYKKLRALINNNCSDFKFIEYGDGVFYKVKMPTCVILGTKNETKNEVDYFEKENRSLFFRNKTIQLSEISNITRGLEIGRNKLLEIGEIQCLNGSSIDRYLIKIIKFISKETLKDFSKKMEIFQSPKLIVRETGNTFFSTIENENSITNRSLYNVRITNNFSEKFILGILNSKLMNFYFKENISPNTNVFPKIRIAQLNEIPIVDIVFTNKNEKHFHDQIVNFVEQLLQLNKDLQATTLETKKEQLKNKIDYCEDKINQLVYELYNLTEDEIKIVENK